ncbi:hypothetical protein KB20921_03090 [Edwardsiella ictaluri]|nr:Uncharacterised protein [Edwardsiella ictaluri]BEH97581.1 hypothetical protein KH20906_03090 [Edwardsiella ictaluri]BEI01048.1 hypothetical protein KB20921_03090 [Edwardsiella ictaluri]BEI04521.1 hypothetical protein KH201010_03070 [Edwardsiella ictaluri]BEI07976.1 hypothetical protein STU22726_03070 [Edwardsiella ictaluri]
MQSYPVYTSADFTSNANAAGKIRATAPTFYATAPPLSVETRTPEHPLRAASAPLRQDPVYRPGRLCCNPVPFSALHTEDMTGL